MITYATNWMGPINMEWFRERGLTEIVSEVLEQDHEFSGLKKGQIHDYETITTYYSAGRIDIRGVPDEPWGLEYSLPPMHGEDWNDFSSWLEDLTTFELWEYEDIIDQYEEDRGTKIRWADRTWFKCHECGLVTDLRKTKKPVHKLDCTRNWSK